MAIRQVLTSHQTSSPDSEGWEVIGSRGAANHGPVNATANEPDEGFADPPFWNEECTKPLYPSESEKKPMWRPTTSTSPAPEPAYSWDITAGETAHSWKLKIVASKSSPTPKPVAKKPVAHTTHPHSGGGCGSLWDPPEIPHQHPLAFNEPRRAERQVVPRVVQPVRQSINPYQPLGGNSLFGAQPQPPFRPNSFYYGYDACGRPMNMGAEHSSHRFSDFSSTQPLHSAFSNGPHVSRASGPGFITEGLMTERSLLKQLHGHHAEVPAHPRLRDPFEQDSFGASDIRNGPRGSSSLHAAGRLGPHSNFGSFNSWADEQPSFKLSRPENANKNMCQRRFPTYRSTEYQ